ncbi:KipI antagonist [compost metagenome]
MQQDTWLSIGGADLAATLDGQPIEPWTAFQVRQRQLLEFHQPVAGVRAYVAAPGGFDSPISLGSRSTVTRDGLGGLDGKGSALVAGSRLSFQGQLATPARITTQVPPDISPAAPTQVVLGAQIAGFCGQSLFDFFNHSWQVDVRADRMGMRLLGPQLRYLGKGLISEGIPLGAIQVPPDGQPIILLNDRQTIGGYPRLGALTPASIARLAQAQPGDQLRFIPTLQETAQKEHLALLDRLQRLAGESVYPGAHWGRSG